MTDQKNEIAQRRQELIEKLAEKYTWKDCNLPKDELNRVYGLNLKLQEFERGSAAEMGWAMRALYNPGSFNPMATEVIRNMLNLRKSNDIENRYKTLPDPVETACRNLKYDVWHGGMAYNAIDPFSDKVRNRTLTREEFEQQIIPKITGADNEAQRRLLEIYFEFKRNGRYFEEGRNEAIDLPKQSYNMTLEEQKNCENKEISEQEWEAYKRKHLNLNPAATQVLNLNSAVSGVFERVKNIFVARRK